jgi:hypothetical protein
MISSPSLSFSSRRLAAPFHRLRAATAASGTRRLAASAASASPVVVGDKLPDATLSYFDPADGELKTVPSAS